MTWTGGPGTIHSAAAKAGIVAMTRTLGILGQEVAVAGRSFIGVDGKTELYNGRTGDKYDNPITVGFMYILKLAHLVDVHHVGIFVMQVE